MGEYSSTHQSAANFLIHLHQIRDPEAQQVVVSDYPTVLVLVFEFVQVKYESWDSQQVG